VTVNPLLIVGIRGLQNIIALSGFRCAVVMSEGEQINIRIDGRVFQMGTFDKQRTVNSVAPRVISLDPYERYPCEYRTEILVVQSSPF
jgi:hypothetical protein